MPFVGPCSRLILRKRPVLEPVIAHYRGTVKFRGDAAFAPRCALLTVAQAALSGDPGPTTAGNPGNLRSMEQGVTHMYFAMQGPRGAQR